MNKNNGKVSDAQKAAQKRYDRDKTKMVSIKYTPLDMNDYDRLKEYLNESGETANRLIKELIHQFLESSNKKSVNFVSGNRTANKYNEGIIIYPFQEIKKENIEYLYSNFTREDVEYLLKQYRKMLIKKIVIENGQKFNEWIEKRIRIMVVENIKLSTEGKGYELLRLFDRYMNM